MNRILIALLCVALTSEIARAEETEGADLEVKKCVNLSRIRRTEIIDDSNIVFYMHGGAMYVNQLPRRCPGLKMAGSYSYRTSVSQICDVDVITVRRHFGPGVFRGPSCGLGSFKPINDEELLALRVKVVEPEPEAVEPEVESTDGPDVEPIEAPEEPADQ